MPTRRWLLKGAVGALVSASSAGVARSTPADLPQGTLDSAVLYALPGKRPLLKRSYRPPNFETPPSAFAQVLTPNDQFFVRWHLASIPEVDADHWRLSVGGPGASNAYELSLAELKADFEPVDIVAVCQCAGNRRGYSDPHVPGVQWGSGAVGNARWKGVRLKDLLARVGIAKDAVEVAYQGGDRPALDATPAYVKSLPVWKAQDDATLIAYEMNGAPLPHWNGSPARLIVPGWVATYWVKQIARIEVLTSPLQGFWMKTAYRIPKGRFPIDDRFPTQSNDTNTPITEMVVNSMITSPEPGARLRRGATTTLRGIAWDAGYGIRRVDVSIDHGQTWSTARLGADLGRYSFRSWEYDLKPPAPGKLTVMARATNAEGATQADVLIYNPAGYHNNVVEPVIYSVS